MSTGSPAPAPGIPFSPSARRHEGAERESCSGQRQTRPSLLRPLLTGKELSRPTGAPLKGHNPSSLGAKRGAALVVCFASFFQARGRLVARKTEGEMKERKKAYDARPLFSSVDPGWPRTLSGERRERERERRSVGATREKFAVPPQQVSFLPTSIPTGQERPNSSRRTAEERVRARAQGRQRGTCERL